MSAQLNAVATDNNSQPSAERGLLRFITAGSVDDGKSTLIGRLLFDSKGIFADQLDAMSRARSTSARSATRSICRY
jgi:sulfate adenylyltransferase subunit 1